MFKRNSPPSYELLENGQVGTYGNGNTKKRSKVVVAFGSLLILIFVAVLCFQERQQAVPIVYKDIFQPSTSSVSGMNMTSGAALWKGRKELEHNQAQHNHEQHKETLAKASGDWKKQTEDKQWRQDPMGMIKKLVQSGAVVEVEECTEIAGIPGFDVPLPCCSAGLSNQGRVWTCHVDDAKMLQKHVAQTVGDVSGQEHKNILDNFMRNGFADNMGGHMTMVDAEAPVDMGNGMILNPGVNYHMAGDIKQENPFHFLNQLFGQSGIIDLSVPSDAGSLDWKNSQMQVGQNGGEVIDLMKELFGM